MRLLRSGEGGLSALSLVKHYSQEAPTPGVFFFAKSAELVENKEIEFFENAKKRKRVQKSAQRCEKTGDDWKTSREKSTSWELENADPLHPRQFA